jgi:hypothetical protein
MQRTNGWSLDRIEVYVFPFSEYGRLADMTFTAQAFDVDGRAPILGSDAATYDGGPVLLLGLDTARF